MRYVRYARYPAIVDKLQHDAGDRLLHKRAGTLQLNIGQAYRASVPGILVREVALSFKDEGEVRVNYMHGCSLFIVTPMSVAI